jgi:hypothetical protein
MFYTGIITSLLPYILLLGVFGTLFLNQALPAQQDKDDHKPAHHQRQGKLDLKGKENSSSCYLAFSQKGPERQPGKQISRVAYKGIPVYSPPGASTSYFKQPARQDKLPGMNQTFSFRGPPQI